MQVKCNDLSWMLFILMKSDTKDRLRASPIKLMDDKVDAFDVLWVLVACLLEDRLWLPVAWVDNVGNSLRILEPPSVSLVAVEVKADVPIRDAKVCDDEFSLSNLVQLDHQAVDKLTSLSIDVCLDVEHWEGLSDATLSEDIWELSVYLHVKVDFFTNKRGG